jgi:glutaconyl-CoA/methylmalonyl-CoA decarboxylase subunit gamma
MKVLLTREGKDHEAEIEVFGSGYRVTLDGREHRVEGAVEPTMRVRVDGRPVEAWVRCRSEEIVVELNGRSFAFRRRDPRAPKLGRRRSLEDATRGKVHAPMPGLVVEVIAQIGEEVEAGRPIVVIEAMKMQNALVAPLSGRVSSIPVTAGTAVETGQLLIAITPDEP